MGMFSNLNKVIASQFVRSPEFAGVSFVNLNVLYANRSADTVYKIADMWVNNKSKFGAHAVLGIVNEKGEAWYNVSIPAHMTEVINQIISSPDMVQAVNDGKCGFKIRPYHSKAYNKDCYSIEFVDIA